MSIKYAKTTVGYVDDDGVKHTKAGTIPTVVAKCGSYLKKNGLYYPVFFIVYQHPTVFLMTYNRPRN